MNEARGDAEIELLSGLLSLFPGSDTLPAESIPHQHRFVADSPIARGRYVTVTILAGTVEPNHAVRQQLRLPVTRHI
jgi:hypothetical protein